MNHILSLDQASKTGWSLIDENGIIVDFGIINGSKIKDYNVRVNFIKHEMAKIMDKYKPIMVTLEGIFAMNKLTYYKLGVLQGVLINYFVENETLYDIIQPTTWKSKLKIKGRKREEQKLNAIRFADSYCKNANIDDNDVADAICMSIYAKENIEIKTTT